MAGHDRRMVSFDKLTLGREASFENARENTGLSADSIRGLAKSIYQDGLLVDLGVFPEPSGGRYVVIDGERRFRAISLLVNGLVKGEDGERLVWPADQLIPVYVLAADDPNLRRKALVANVQREDLSGYEVAMELQRQAETLGRSLGDLAHDFGKTKAWASGHLTALRKSTDHVKEAWKAGKITTTDAYSLVKRYEDPRKQDAALEAVLSWRNVAAKGSKSKASAVANAREPSLKPREIELQVLFTELEAHEERSPAAQGALAALNWVLGNGDGDLSMLLGFPMPDVKAKAKELRKRQRAEQPPADDETTEEPAHAGAEE